MMVYLTSPFPSLLRRGTKETFPPLLVMSGKFEQNHQILIIFLK